MATMDDLIEEILAEYEPRPILDEPIPEAEERLPSRPFRPQWPFTDLDDRVPYPVRLPANEPWVEILNDAKDEFEVDGAAAVFSTWRVEGEDPLDIDDIEIGDGMHARAGRLALDTRMADVRANQLLAALPGGTEFLLRIKFLWEKAYYSAFFVRATDVSATIFGGTHTSLFPVETDGDIGMPRKTQISARSGYTQQRGLHGTPYSARLRDCHFSGRPNFQLDRQ